MFGFGDINSRPVFVNSSEKVGIILNFTVCFIAMDDEDNKLFLVMLSVSSSVCIRKCWP